MDPNEYHQSRDIQPILGQVVKPTTLSGGGKVYMIHPARITNQEVEGADLQTEVDTETTIPVHFISTQGPNDGDFIVGIPLGPKLIASRKSGTTATIKGRIIFDWPWIGWPTLPPPDLVNPVVMAPVAILRGATTAVAPQDYITSGWFAGQPATGWTVLSGGGPLSITNQFTPLFEWFDPNDYTQGVTYSFDHNLGTFNFRLHKPCYNPLVHSNVSLNAGDVIDWGLERMTVNPVWDKCSACDHGLYSAYYWTGPKPNPQGLYPTEYVTFRAITDFGEVDLIRSAGTTAQNLWTGTLDTYINGNRWQLTFSLQCTPRNANTYGRKVIGDIQMMVTGTMLVYDTFYLPGEFGGDTGLPHWHPHLYSTGNSIAGFPDDNYANDFTGTWGAALYSGSNIAFVNIYDNTSLLNRPYDFYVDVPITLYTPRSGYNNGGLPALNPWNGPAHIEVAQTWKGWPAQVRWESWHPSA